MRSLVLRWAIIAIAVVIAADLFPSHVSYSGWRAVAGFAIVLGLLNAFVRPVILLLSLPITCLTVGLFTLVVNAATYWMASRLPTGVEVNGFASAFLGALIVSAVSLIASLITRTEKRARAYR